MTRRSDQNNKPIKFESKIAVLKLLSNSSFFLLVPQRFKIYSYLGTPKHLSIISDHETSLNIRANELDSLACVVIDGVPEPLINWKLSDGTVLNKYSKIMREIIYENSTNTKINKYTSLLETTASIDWEGKSIECYITHPTRDTIMTDKKKIELSCKK